jgi:hypothetical protein
MKMILKLAYHIQKQNFMKCILLFKCEEEINTKYARLKQISGMGSLSNGYVQYVVTHPNFNKGLLQNNFYIFTAL